MSFPGMSMPGGGAAASLDPEKLKEQQMVKMVRYMKMSIRAGLLTLCRCKQRWSRVLASRLYLVSWDLDWAVSLDSSCRV